MHQSLIATDLTRTRPDVPRGAVITVIAEKGGVGKTTVISNVAAALAKDTPAHEGLSVLAIDGESQSNLALALGASIDPEDASLADGLVAASRDYETGTFDVLTEAFSQMPLTATACPNVLLLPGGDALVEAADVILGGGAAGEQWMGHLCAFFAQFFDVVVIDTPPSAMLRPLSFGSVMAADVALVPMHAEQGWSLDALDRLAGHVAQLPTAPPLLPVATLADRRLVYFREMQQAVAEETEGGYLADNDELLTRVLGDRRQGGWLAVVPRDKTVQASGLSGEPVVIGRRSGSLAAVALRNLATDALTIADLNMEPVR